MKKYLLFAFAGLAGCIQTDHEDPLPVEFRISNSIRDVTFRVNGFYVLEVTYIDDRGDTTDAPVEWKTSDPKIVSFNGDTAFAHAEGKALISAKSGDQTDEVTIEVEESRESIVINGVTMLAVGASFRFSVNYLDINGDSATVRPVWTSSDESVATVNAEGLVSGISPGSVQVSASHGKVSANFTVRIETVVDIDPEIRIETFKEFLKEGDVFIFKASYYGRDALPDPSITLSWSTSDASVLSIDQSGKATALVAGMAKVIVSSGGLSDTVSVEVEAKQNLERSGSLTGSGGYNISGNFMLSTNNSGEIILTIKNYVPDSGPGLYFYLSNSQTGISNGLKLGEAKRQGDYEINITSINKQVDLNTYNYLIVWCEPFGVRFGWGAFNQ